MNKVIFTSKGDFGIVSKSNSSKIHFSIPKPDGSLSRKSVPNQGYTAITLTCYLPDSLIPSLIDDET